MLRFNKMSWALLLLNPIAFAPVNQSSIPTLLSPQQSELLDNGCSSRNNPITWKFVWSTVPNATAYHLVVRSSKASVPAIDLANLTASEYVDQRLGYIIDRNRPGWRWKVRAKVNGTWGDWSEERVFDVEPLDTDCSTLGNSPGLTPSNPPNQPVQTVLPSSTIAASTSNRRKAEADRLYKAGEAELFQNAFKVNPEERLPSPSSIDKLEQALKLYQEIGDRPSELQTQVLLRMAFQLRKDYTKLLKLAQEAIIQAQQPGGDPSEEVNALLLLGQAYFNLRDYPKAIQSYQQSLVKNQPLADPMVAWRASEALNTLGYIALLQQSYPQAVEYLRKAAKASGTFISSVPGSDAKNLNVSPQLGYALYKAGQFAEAQAVLLEWFKATDIPGWTLPAGAWERQSDGWNFRLDADRDTNNLASFLSKNSWGESSILQLLLLAANQPEQALEISEQGRARALARLLSSQITSQTAGPPIPLPGTATRGQGGTIFTNEVRGLGQGKVCVNGVCRETSGTQVTRTSTFMPDKIPVNPQSEPSIDWRGIQQIAQKRQATLVQYSLLSPDLNDKLEPLPPTELLIYVVQPNGKLTVRRVNLKRLAQQKTSLAALVTQGQSSIGVTRGVTFQEDTSIAKQPFPKLKNSDLQILHQLLIEPIADLLPQDPQKPVILIPQAELFLVPFAALQDQAGEYLIEKHTLLMSPSIQTLNLTEKLRERRRQAPAQEVVIVGNPIMPKVALTPQSAPRQLTSLPGAEKEAISIGRLLQVSPLIGAQATKVAVLQRIRQARIIHLATHGLLYETPASRIPGVIALAPTPQDSGLLTADEIFNLQFQAELVVLSACDTGSGFITGDGVVGLSRSLMAAGVPSLVVSLWQVPDGPTADLMTRFYKNLQEKPDKAQALRQAMLDTMQQFPNPKDWAAFILMGEAI